MYAVCVLFQSHELGSGPDNVVVDPVTGDLYIASHPVGHKLIMHLNDPTLRAPSQVIWVTNMGHS